MITARKHFPRKSLTKQLLRWHCVCSNKAPTTFKSSVCSWFHLLRFCPFNFFSHPNPRGSGELGGWARQNLKEKRVTRIESHSNAKIAVDGHKRTQNERKTALVRAGAHICISFTQWRDVWFFNDGCRMKFKSSLRDLKCLRRQNNCLTAICPSPLFLPCSSLLVCDTFTNHLHSTMSLNSSVVRSGCNVPQRTFISCTVKPSSAVRILVILTKFDKYSRVYFFFFFF